MSLPTITTRFFCLLLTVAAASSCATAEIVFDPSNDKGHGVPGGGLFRVSYNASSPCIDTVVMVGVGTAMKVGDYSDLSEKVFNEDSSIAFVMADNRPGNPIKQAWWDGDTKPRTSLGRVADYVKDHIGEYVHELCDIEGTKFVLGGHSSNAITAAEAILYNVVSFHIDAYLGIDPDYKRLPTNPKPWDGLDLSSLPSMMWGNSINNCLVSVDAGGKFGYEKSDHSHRALYQIQRPASGRGHCDVTDNGCVDGVCPLSDQSELVRQAVAESISKLSTVLRRSAYFSHATLALQTSLLDVKLFVNGDQVVATSEESTVATGSMPGLANA